MTMSILAQKIGDDAKFAAFKSSLIKQYRERPKRLGNAFARR